MTSIDLYNLGPVTWWESQAYYHALAHLGREGLLICYPLTPYVCLGLHDDLEQEIDEAYCAEHNIPLMRREAGGGVVYLDSQQVFYQLVLRRDNARLPLQRSRYYKSFLAPAISAYRTLGVPAELKKPADIVAEGRKCSGNAAGDIGLGAVYIGNILIHFDYRTMSRVLKMPFKDFQNFFYLSMCHNMTVLQDWVDKEVGYDQIANLLIDGFRSRIDLLEECSVDNELAEKAQELKNELTSREWLCLPGRRSEKRRIKIAEEIYLQETAIKNGTPAAELIKHGVAERIFLPGDAGIYQPLQQV